MVAPPDEHQRDDPSTEQALANQLAQGREPTPSGPLPTDPDQSRQSEDLRACLWLVRRVFPGTTRERPSDPSMDGPWPPPPEQKQETPGPAAMPEQLGRFQILRELGRGGFGVVSLAFDPALNRRVALKVPLPEVLASPEGHRQSMREAQAAAVLDHPNLVPVYEAGWIGPVPYVASAYCEGIDLGKWLRQRDGPVPPRLAARLTAKLAGAVQHAHERGILHRDLKPANVLMQRPSADLQDEDGFIPRITDFGLAKQVSGPREETLSALLVGSPPYMAPEQAAGKRSEIGPKTDIYALGAVLYELLTGRPPHQGETPLETVQQVLATEPKPPRQLRPGLPADLQTIVLKCLEKAPDRRYESARALADDLQRFLDGHPVHARRSDLLTRLRLWVLDPRRTLDAGSLTMAFAALLTVWCLTGITLATLGVGPSAPRPAEYIASCVQVILLDLAPASPSDG